MLNKKTILTAVLLLCLLASAASAATLNVGSKEKYKTIQSAVNVAKTGDTINVASGTYSEYVNVNKNLNIYGTNYPKVNGFNINGGGMLNGFSIQKNGITTHGPDYQETIRNNYFYNCGISVIGDLGKGITIMNNQISKGEISITMTTKNVKITGNTVTNTDIGLLVNHVEKLPTVTNNTFKNCNYGIYLLGYNHDPGKLATFSGNKYINDKVGIGWGTDN